MEYRKITDEYTALPKEFDAAAEYRVNTADEFKVKRTRPINEVRASLHDRIGKLMMMPLAASITTFSIVFAAFGEDPLKDGVNLVENVAVESAKTRAAKAKVEPFSFENPSYSVSERSAYAVVHVTYKPTGAVFKSTERGYSGFLEARDWVEEQGGDPYSMKLVNIAMIEETVHSAGAFFVGDEDDKENQYWVNDDPFDMNVEHDYYEAYEAGGDSVSISYATACKAFPKLGNLDPADNVPLPGTNLVAAYEEYIIADGNIIYVDPHRGSASDTDSSISYDPDSNTLTLNNYSGDNIEINLMGNGFKLELKGSNYVGGITAWGFYYGGSITVCGDGSLVVNSDYENPVGLAFRGEYSNSCLMVDSTIEYLQVNGAYTAIAIEASSSDEGIYYKEPLNMFGGAISKGDFIIDSSGSFASKQRGYSDFLVTDGETGLPSRSVLFVPRQEE